MRSILSPVLICLLLCACEAQREPTGQGRLYDGQRKVLEKAKGVESTVLQADEQRRAEEEAQSR